MNAGKRWQILFASLPSAAALLALALAWTLHAKHQAGRGQRLNREAWEASYAERGLPVPPGGPREGYWGARLGGKAVADDPEVRWREREVSIPGLVEIDGRGRQRWLPGAAPRARVLVLGGSVGFGAYASGADETWFAVMGRELARRGLPAEVVVAASGAWKASQEAAELRGCFGELRPDAVVMLDGLNDLLNGPCAGKLFGDRVPTPDDQPWSSTWHAGDIDARVAAYLACVKDAAGVAGGKLLVVLQPSLAEKAALTHLEEELLRGTHVPAADLRRGYAGMRAGLAASGVAFLDASRAFDGEEATTFADAWHFSDPGHAVLGLLAARAVEDLLAGGLRK